MKPLDSVEPRTPILPGDVPLEITSPGSYYLAGDLDCVGLPENQACLEISADDVSIDLMGFAIRGGFWGINGSTALRTVVKNGSIIDPTANGINLTGSHTTVSRILVSGGGVTGLRLGPNAHVEDCAVNGTGSYGMIIGANSLVLNSQFTDNDLFGILVKTNSRISNSIIADNGGYGIHVETNAKGVSIESCTVTSNGQGGIGVTSHCIIRDNYCYGNSPGGAIGAGIEVIGEFNRIEGNNLIGNDIGLKVDVGGNTIYRNSASGNSTNYSIASGNDVGPISNAASATSPWANLVF